MLNYAGNVLWPQADKQLKLDRLLFNGVGFSERETERESMVIRIHPL
jgi:hypothetical protein